MGGATQNARADPQKPRRRKKPRTTLEEAVKQAFPFGRGMDLLVGVLSIVGKAPASLHTSHSLTHTLTLTHPHTHAHTLTHSHTHTSTNTRDAGYKKAEQMNLKCHVLHTRLLKLLVDSMESRFWPALSTLTSLEKWVIVTLQRAFPLHHFS